MGPKNKKKSKDDDEDWEALLDAEVAKNAVIAAAETPKVEAEAVATAGEDDDDSDGDEAPGAAKDKDKKKKKKKAKAAGAKKEDDPAAPKVPTTAAGKLILERRLAKEAEEARIAAAIAAEEARIKAEEEAEERERKAIEDDKEKKRLAKAAKVDAQKAAGTYLTPAQKAKAKANEQRLDAMRQAGMLVGGGSAGAGAGAGAPAEKAPLPDGRKTGPKKPVGKTPEQLEEERVQKEEEEAAVAAAAAAAAASASAAKTKTAAVATSAKDVDVDVEDWEKAGSDEDDWEANLDSMVEKLEDTLEKAASLVEVEDELDVDKGKELERLRKLGLERAKRDEEARLKREAEEHLRAEMEQKEIEKMLKKENSRKRRVAKANAARAARTKDRLRSPISCIMGHVDTGKTSLLDKIRHTNVQEGEAGGITQQIGATQFSRETLVVQTASMQRSFPLDLRLPGLLMIDTPGHASFSNLRTRGSSLCDAAVLVVDLMHGLEQQTIESLNMLRNGKTPFVIALNKVDRLYGWKSTPDSPFRESLARQDDNTRGEFKDRCADAILQLNQQGINVKLYWENDDPLDTVSIVPTSAHTGEGVPDLLQNILHITQEMQTEKLMYVELLQCTVLEVKIIEGLGATMDVVLVNGTLREGDTIVISTMDGPVTTQIRSLLTPPPNRESRVKSEYIKHTQISGATGVKIVAADVGRAIAGTSVLVIEPEDDPEDVREDVQSDLSKIMEALEVDAKGVMVHASTLGALEALIRFLRKDCNPPIPVSHISIGTIFKKDIIRANMMNERGMPEFATILAFDVKVDGEAQAMADSDKVNIFSADIIYHLFDQFSAFMKGINDKRRADAEAVVQFPCILKIFQQHVFNKKNPIVVGVEVLEGQVRLGTTLCIPSMDCFIVGVVDAIQENHKDVTKAVKGRQVSIKIRNDANPTITFGRQFDHTHALYSKMSRASIDALKEYFKEEMSKEDWGLVVKLKPLFDIK